MNFKKFSLMAVITLVIGLFPLTVFGATSECSLVNVNGNEPVLPGYRGLAISVDINNTSEVDYILKDVTPQMYLKLGKNGINVANNGYYFTSEQEAQDYFFQKCLLESGGKVGLMDCDFTKILPQRVKAGEHYQALIPVEIAGRETGNTYQGCDFDFSLSVDMAEDKVIPVEPPITDDIDTDNNDTDKSNNDVIKDSTEQKTNKNDIPQTGDNDMTLIISIAVVGLCSILLNILFICRISRLKKTYKEHKTIMRKLP